MSPRRAAASAWLLLAGLGRMLGAAPASARPNACTTISSTSTATCTGNQSAGVRSGVDFPDNRFNNVVVNNLSVGITPAAGVRGIEVAPGSNSLANGSTIIFSSGAHGIVTTGSAAYGIFSRMQGGAGGAGSNNVFSG